MATSTRAETSFSSRQRVFEIIDVWVSGGFQLALVSVSFIQLYLGCILLGLFWVFLFQFRNNRIHGISIPKRSLLVKTEYPWRRWPENYYYVCGRVGFPAQNFPKKRVFCLFRVSRIPFILFILLSGADWTVWYSPHSESLIAPKRTHIPSIPSIPIPE